MKFSPPDRHLLSVGSLETKIRNILVPIDFSPCADDALRQALVLALRSHASLTLMHALHIPMKTTGVTTMEELEREAAENLKQVADELREWLRNTFLPALEIKTKLCIGFPAEEIIHAAQSLHSEVVVMGTQGAGRVEGFLLGSNAATVMRHSKVPVWAVPEGKLLYNLKRLVFATDLEVIDFEAVNEAALIAGLFDAELELLHIYTPNEAIAPEQMNAFREKVNSIVSYPKLKFSGYETTHNDVATALDQYARETGAEVMALLKRERGFFAGLFHNSVTKQLAVQAHFPVLVFHE